MSATATAGAQWEFYLKLQETSSAGTTLGRSLYGITVGSRVRSGISSPFHVVDDDTSTSSGDNDGHVEPL